MVFDGSFMPPATHVASWLLQQPRASSGGSSRLAQAQPHSYSYIGRTHGGTALPEDNATSLHWLATKHLHATAL
jgi:hypothetical protein